MNVDILKILCSLRNADARLEVQGGQDFALGLSWAKTYGYAKIGLSELATRARLAARIRRVQLPWFSG